MDPKDITPGPSRPPYAATDRELLLALLNVTCALAEKLTGHRVEFLITCEDGERAWAKADDLLGVRWSER
jgi:hypothetical protein